MKIALPKVRPSRKLMIILLGTFVLFGGTGAFALILGMEPLLGSPEYTVIGRQCANVQSVVIRTPNDRLWLRKFVRMDNTDGVTRIKTAMRVAGLLARDNPVDLINVVILDTNGPVKRADMRARALGAEVLVALNPDQLTEMKQPIVAKYYEGNASPEGRFYGKRVEVSLAEIETMMTAMKTVEDKADCVEPGPEHVEEKSAKPKKSPHLAAAAEEKTDGHGGAPAPASASEDQH